MDAASYDGDGESPAERLRPVVQGQTQAEETWRGTIDPHELR